MKRSIKLMGILLSFALLFSIVTPLTVNAVGGAYNEEKTIPSSQKTLYSAKGSAVPDSLYRELATMNVTVNSDTLIEIIQMDSGTGSALVVTNINETTVSKDIIFGVEEDGQVTTIQPVDESSAMTRAGYHTWFSDDCLSLVKATAVYNILYIERMDIGYGQYIEWSPLYQPQGVYFFYYDNGVNEVTYIEVLYVCQGVHCTYPDKTPIDGTIPIAHPIVVAKRNPNSNTIYSTTDPLEAGTGLDVVEGLCVQRLSIKMEVDGDIIEDGVVF